MRKLLLLTAWFGTVLILGSMAVPGSEPPETNAPTVMPLITVSATNQSPSLTSPSIEEGSRQKSGTPGGLTIKDAGQMEGGRASSFQDLLAGIPGITLQSENGMELTKYSSRGSGILSDDEPFGVIFLLDGFPFNQGDGEVILEDFSLSSLKYAEVYRGANAFKYGAITLGGAVNLASKTGYDADPLEVRVAGGSYGFLRSGLSSGGVDGAVDYFVSATGRLRDGFRERSSENTEDLFANLGYRIQDHLEDRFYLSLTRTDRLLPGGISQDQMAENPRQAAPESIAQGLDKKWDYLRLADKVSLKTGVEEADAGVYWWHRNLGARGLFNADSPEGIQDYYADNFGALLNSATRTRVFGQENVLTLGFTPTWERQVDVNFQNNSGQKGLLTGHGQEVSFNAAIYAEDQQYLTEHLSVLAGIQAIKATRRFSDYLGNTASGDQSTKLDFQTVNPKVGVIYGWDDQNQVYANVSRSWQPPSFDNMLNYDDNNPPPPYGNGGLVFTPLAAQRAWTVEIGDRGELGRVGWEISLYHSWVRNELLEINDAFGVARGAVNVDRAYHQGIEAGLQIEILDSLLFPKNKAREIDRLTLNQTYTLNDFHFDGDPVYGNNRIGGLPVHVYQAELRYETPGGFYAGPNLQWNITPYPVDHANSLNASSYALLGFKMGWRFKNGWSCFFEARNLTDAIYAASVDPIPDARTTSGPAEIFHPGDGRAFYAGFSWRLR